VGVRLERKAAASGASFLTLGEASLSLPFSPSLAPFMLAVRFRGDEAAATSRPSWGSSALKSSDAAAVPFGQNANGERKETYGIF